MLGVSAVSSFGPSRASGAYDFFITEDLLKDLATRRTILYPVTVTPKHRKDSVNPLASDCELHIAVEPSTTLAWPAGMVIEPPMVCKETKPLLKIGNGQPKTTTVSSWPDFLDKYVMGKSNCVATGFPRIFTEHSGGTESATNPNHIFELHPLLSITCDDATIEMTQFLKYYDGMRHIKDTSAASCLTGRELHVTYNGADKRYEFQESGGAGCGNFAILKLDIYPDWVQEIHEHDTNGHVVRTVGHSAIARGAAGDTPVGTVKVYSFAGTPEDDLLAQIKTMNPGTPFKRTYFLGLLTYDYFAIIKAVQGKDANGNYFWLQPNEVNDKKVEFPFAFVLFGEVANMPDEEHQ